MRDQDILNKTEAGRDEIEHRTRKLPTVLRSLLLLVDGQRDVAQLRAVAAGLHGPSDALDQLVALGLIGIGAQAPAAARPTLAAANVPNPAGAPGTEAAQRLAMADTANRYGVLYAMMSDAVREQLGLRGYFLQLKIERSTDLAELAKLLPDLRAAVTKARDAAWADELDRRLRAAAQL
ncbi:MULTISPECIES: hypothetical protein [unclassified Lysobacter]|uniref:hypothetical protein n=1 Tax=unclassified Lysobacter TaxID=2635362 RepID=UPI0006FB8C29|nr:MULTISPECIES: hypothetical protein [unclassified Lysobacter]KRA19842.1 hypothetical protein ASD69_00240 [Lysobacter sp. Root604]KRD38856.1 hypothetical protein ASE35_00240 [Lysobacter sp. Root916]KRD78418.1 hypothetical protein ASE43_20605 [Lysobacter sp. Root983]